MDLNVIINDDDKDGAVTVVDQKDAVRMTFENVISYF